jgi:hypothetical protein
MIAEADINDLSEEADRYRTGSRKEYRQRSLTESFVSAPDAFDLPGRRIWLLSTAELESQFVSLVAQWKQATKLSALPSQQIMHKAYQRIIGMGPPVLPLILEEMDREPDHWFWALTALTGIDLASDDPNVSFDELTRRWLDWGRAREYVS